MFLYLNVTKMQQIGLCLDDALDSILEPILQRFFFHIFGSHNETLVKSLVFLGLVPVLSTVGLLFALKL